jgi:2-(1,2-epoxy-1,2-dihydrophenyl)acetyl-CoA isomerase
MLRPYDFISVGIRIYLARTHSNHERRLIMSNTTNEEIRVDVADRVATITLNRPEKLNAITPSMMAKGVAFLKDIAGDAEVGAVVVTGQGRAFCAGGDVSSMAAGGSAQIGLEGGTDITRRMQEFGWLLNTIPKVTIAAVNGFAVGAGFPIALACDLRIASAEAKLGTAFARIGLSGDFGAAWLLTRLVGPARAKEMLLLPDMIDAEEALRLGLVNRVVPHDEFQNAVKDLAGRIASGPLVSYRYIKENVNLAGDCDFRSALDREAMTQTICFRTADHMEGVMAFMEKREPNFQGK